MKSKSKQAATKSKNSPRRKEDENESDNEEQGFTKWLRSEDGWETLKLFVFGNTLVCFLLISWPEMKQTMDAFYYSYMDYNKS
ncbi:hypothetical protein GWI33_003466 [Rhynchophorus ferrugineus]|uniref:Uncharacterized protein n=1 Tax=Rhynchophorus ferrugineus TaxID=354439 RepID=A0A834IQY5_RHYFE|nr:hypothetical protein GWI33_003466 [Rhynchophorus ferrugineus]